MQKKTYILTIYLLFVSAYRNFKEFSTYYLRITVTYPAFCLGAENLKTGHDLQDIPYKKFTECNAYYLRNMVGLDKQ